MAYEPKKLDDKKVLRVLRTLYKAVKKAAKKKNRLPLFGVSGVRFDDKGKVLFDVSGDTADMAEALRRIGVTVYQTFAGVSEFTDESYMMDGYDRRPLKTEYWFAVAYLLNGPANDLKSFEVMLGWKNAFRQWFDAQQAKRAARKEALLQEQKAKWEARQVDIGNTTRALMAFDRTARWLKIKWRLGLWCDLQKTQIFNGFFGATNIAAIVLFCLYNAAWSAWPVLAIFSVIFVLAVTVVTLLWRWLDVPHSIDAMCLGVVVLIYASMSSYTAYFSTPFESRENRNLVLIDRDNGALVGRLPNDEADRFLTWKEMAIPLFRYRVEPGLPLSAKKEFEMVFGDETLKFSAAFKLNAYYALIDETAAAYTLAWNYWEKPENLHAAVMDVFARILEDTRTEFEKEIEPFKSGAKKFGGAEAKALFKKLEKEIRYYFRAYKGGLFCFDLVIAFTETPYYNFAEARMAETAALMSDVVRNDASDIHAE